jgi:hypothetical protein
MAFSVFVEIINLRIRGKPAEPVHLRDPYHLTDEAKAGPTPPLGQAAPGAAEQGES